jgi:hypothetical protein
LEVHWLLACALGRRNNPGDLHRAWDILYNEVVHFPLASDVPSDAPRVMRKRVEDHVAQLGRIKKDIYRASGCDILSLLYARIT